MMTSGFRLSASNWSSIESPPTSSATRRSVKWLRPRANLTVCMASSRVGDRISARAPTRGECARSFSSTGMRKAAVLPEPVRAMHTMSFPASASGSDLRCTGVGSL